MVNKLKAIYQIVVSEEYFLVVAKGYKIDENSNKVESLTTRSVGNYSWYLLKAVEHLIDKLIWE